MTDSPKRRWARRRILASHTLPKGEFPTSAQVTDYLKLHTYPGTPEPPGSAPSSVREGVPPGVRVPPVAPSREAAPLHAPRMVVDEPITGPARPEPPRAKQTPSGTDRSASPLGQFPVQPALLVFAGAGPLIGGLPAASVSGRNIGPESRACPFQPCAERFIASEKRRFVRHVVKVHRDQIALMLKGSVARPAEDTDIPAGAFMSPPAGPPGSDTRGAPDAPR